MNPMYCLFEYSGQGSYTLQINPGESSFTGFFILMIYNLLVPVLGCLVGLRSYLTGHCTMAFLSDYGDEKVFVRRKSQ